MSDASGAKTGTQGRGPTDRPLSPHMSVWRWHVTMFTSILHRLTGLKLYGGVLIIAGWVVALAMGRQAFDAYRALLGSPIGLLSLFLLTFGLFYHLANGVRHLFWDTGKGFDPKTADMTGWATIAFGVVATVLIWAIAIVRIAG